MPPPYIYGESAQTVIDRNHHKAENIRFLLTQPTIKVRSKTVPYSLYFFSSNIDHYIHDKMNLAGRDKIHLAERFADRCDDDPKAFVTRICEHCQALKGMNYSESWDFIMEEGSCHSIKRHTNFNIYINALLEKLQN